MALTRFGGGVAELRGSTGGNTFTRGKAGAVQRSRVKPAQPQSSFQLDQRSILTELSVAWGQTLTQVQRDGWAIFGQNFPSVNKLGDVISLSGIQAFQGVGARLMASGTAYLAVAPANQDVSELQTVTLTLDIGAGSFQLAWTAVGTLDDDKLVVLMTPGISPGITNYASLLRPVLYTAIDPASPTNLEAAFIARFGALPQVGQKIGMRGHFLRSTNGAISSDLSAAGLVVST